MRYVGGKARISGWIEQIILSVRTHETRYIEPFVGGANVLLRISHHFPTVIAGDIHPDLVMLLSAVGRGWIPPVISAQLYKNLRHTAPSPLRGFAGFGCSFGGKWFGGFTECPWDAHHKRYTRSYQGAARGALLKSREALSRVHWVIGSYEAFQPTHGDIVYCDPPYKNTLGYTTHFNSPHFWEIAASWSERGATVLVSEQTAPNGWDIIAARTRKSQLRVVRGTSNTIRQEFVFRWKG